MIDYEAIRREAMANSIDNRPYGYDKAIIEAYERQKAAPEWVPLDLEKVKQGWELWQGHWPEGSAHYRFVSTYEGELIVAAKAGTGICRRAMEGIPWLMRAPKPKTVRVEVLMEHIRKELRVQLASESPPVGYWQVVGEGDIEVRE